MGYRTSDTGLKCPYCGKFKHGHLKNRYRDIVLVKNQTLNLPTCLIGSRIKIMVIEKMVK